MKKGSKKGNNYIIEGNIVKMELKRYGGKESLWTVFSLEDLEKVISYPYTWHAKLSTSNKKLYVIASIHGKKHTSIQLQMYIMDLNGGHEEIADHINHDTLDNRRENLRVINNSENSQNRKSRNSNNQTGYRNVSYIKKDSVHPYWVQLSVKGKGRVFGKFSDVDEAGAFAEEMRQKYYGEFAGHDL